MPIISPFFFFMVKTQSTRNQVPGRTLRSNCNSEGVEIETYGHFLVGCLFLRAPSLSLKAGTPTRPAACQVKAELLFLARRGVTESGRQNRTQWEGTIQTGVLRGGSREAERWGAGG